MTERLVPRVHPVITDRQMTKTEFQEEVDINNIVAKYQRDGALTHFQFNAEDYGIATGLSFHEAATLVADARSLFADLPSSLRARFNNDPGQFLDFVQDPSNAQEMVELGLTDSPTHHPGPFANTTPAIPRGTGAASQGSPPTAEPNSAQEGGAAAAEPGQNT